MSSKISFLVVGVVFSVLFSLPFANAENLDVPVNPGPGDDLTDVVVPGQTTTNLVRTFNIHVKNSCFGTNLRSVANPIGPDSMVTFKFKLKHEGVDIVGFAEYDGKAVKMQGMDVDNMMVISNKSPADMRGAQLGNLVRLELPVNVKTTVGADGEIIEENAPKFTDYEFIQKVKAGVPQGQYMAKDGPLSAKVHFYQSPGSYSVEVKADFPGQNGYCGGYYSPLMAFFDDQRPKFTGKSDFPLNPAGKTFWPEENAPGFFVALDRNNDGKISKLDELFGQTEKFENGFESLKSLDSNHDGVIDAKDKKFKKLVLFRDWHGKHELIKLATKIDSISLKYDNRSLSSVEDRAQIKEKSTFTFTEDGKVKTGQMIDVWFSPTN